MGIDTHIYLFSNVTARNVVNVIGVLGGCRPYKKHFDDKHPSNGWSTWVEGASLETTGCPEMARMVFRPDRGDFAHGGSDWASAFYHWEPSAPYRSMRLLSPQCCDHWIAIGVCLVRMFGGHVDFNDSDSSDVDFQVPMKPDDEVSPSDGAAWYAFQETLLALKPLSRDDIETINNVMVRQGGGIRTGGIAGVTYS